MIPGITAGGAVAAGGGATDPDFASTILLLSGDGANGATVFTDESAAARGNAAVTNGTTVTTGNKVFGTGSILFGLNDNIGFSDHADWTLGTSDFTLEFFAYIEDNTKLSTFVSHYNATGQRGWAFQYRGADATDNLALVGSSNGTSASFIMQPAFTPTNQTWYYYCLERSGNTFRIYAGPTGGTAAMVGSASNAINFFNSTAGLIISGETGTISGRMIGNIDELRFTLGVARYATDAGFAVPTSAFPRS